MDETETRHNTEEERQIPGVHGNIAELHGNIAEEETQITGVNGNIMKWAQTTTICQAEIVTTIIQT